MIEIWKDIKNYEGYYQISNLGNIKSLERIVKVNNNGDFGKKQERVLKPHLQNNGYYYITLYKGNKRKNNLIHRLVADAFIDNPNNYPIINHKDENKQNNNVENLEWCTYSYNVNYGTAIERANENKKDYAVSDETRKKISEANKGKNVSEDTRKRISEALKGKQRTKEQIENWRKSYKEGNHGGENHPMFGKHQTEEAKRAISEKNKNKLCGEKNPMFGKTHTEEALKKMRKRIVQLDKNTGEIIREWDSITEASNTLKIGNGNLSRCCRDNTKTCGGYKWKYLD